MLTHIPLDKCELRPPFESICHEAMTIKALAGQRNKQCTRDGLPGINDCLGNDPLDPLGLITQRLMTSAIVRYPL